MLSIDSEILNRSIDLLLIIIYCRRNLQPRLLAVEQTVKNSQTPASQRRGCQLVFISIASEMAVQEALIIKCRTVSGLDIEYLVAVLDDHLELVL